MFSFPQPAKRLILISLKKKKTQKIQFPATLISMIQVWSCGGSMEVVPCSRVAHLDHHSLPYTFPDQDLLQSNKIRIAELWMDAYRRIFYRRDTLAHFIRQVGGDGTGCSLNTSCIGVTVAMFWCSLRAPTSQSVCSSRRVSDARTSSGT